MAAHDKNENEMFMKAGNQMQLESHCVSLSKLFISHFG